MNKVRLALSALALAAVLGFAGQSASAAFTYSLSPTSINVGFSNSSLSIAAYNGGITSPTLSGTQIINLAQITQTSATVPPATDSAIIPFTFSININNLNGGGSAPFTLTGNINVTRSDTQGAISTFSLTSILPPVITLDSRQYSISSFSYAAPTIQAGLSGSGALSAVITETVIPEPASLMVLGLGATALMARRRRA